MTILEPWQSLLPDSAQQLIHVIGWADTARLINAFGGTTLPMPSGVNAIGRATLALLAEKMGDEVTQKLAHYYGGAPLYVPRCDAALRRARDNVIISEFETRIRAKETATSAVNLLAMQHKLTDRRIWKILKTTPPDDPTPDLFHGFA